jgi:iron complex outermembrane receptor protein
MFKHIPIFLLFSCALSAQSFSSISGRVLDPSGAVVKGAVVQLQNRDGSARRTAQSSSMGEYLFEAVTPAEYLLTANAPGFDASEGKTVHTEAGGKTALDLALRLSHVSARVVVTASGIAQSTDETAKAFDIIDTDQMERRQEFSVVEALRLTAGMRVMQLGGPGAMTTIFTRGLRAYDTSILVDGFRLRDVAAPQSDASAYIGDLLTGGSDRIEVLRGSGSSLYGTNSIGGVVNISTDNGGGTPHGEISAEGGGLGLLRGSASVAGGVRQDRVLYSATLAHLNVSKGVDGDDAHRNTTGRAFVKAQLASKTSASARFWVTDTFAQLNVSPSALNVPASATPPVRAIAGTNFNASPNDPDSRRAAKTFNGLFSVTHQLSSAVSLRGVYSAVRTSRDNRNGPGGPGFQPSFNNSSKFDGRLDTVQTRADVTAGPHNQITAGYEFEREHFDNPANDENPNAAARVNTRSQATLQSHALFAQDQISVGKLRASLSGRWQKFDLQRPTFTGGAPVYANVAIPTPPDSFTGDLAVSYLVKSSKLRAHLGNSYRAPALYERFGSSFFGGFFSAYGDPRLAPERAISFDAGFDQYLAQSKLRLSGTYFYTKLREVIGFDFSGAIPANDPYGRFGGYLNTGGGIARGFEVSAEARPARHTTVLASYTYTKAQERRSSLIGGSTKTIRVPDHMFTFTGTQKVYKGFDVTFDLFASNDYIYPLFTTGSMPFRFDGPIKADLAASYRQPLGERTSIEFFTRIENLFDRTYYESGFRTPGLWATGGARYRF